MIITIKQVMMIYMQLEMQLIERLLLSIVALEELHVEVARVVLSWLLVHIGRIKDIVDVGG